MLSKYIFKVSGDSPGAQFTNMKLTLILEWISNYIHYKVCDEITYPFPISYGCNAEVWEWTINVSHTLLAVYLLIYAGIKVNSC